MWLGTLLLCAAPGCVDVSAKADAADLQQQSAPLAPIALWIVFEPALPKAATLSIAHESGWTMQCPASPSGVEVRMPEGPASLVLQMGDEAYEGSIKATPGQTLVTWHWQER